MSLTRLAGGKPAFVVVTTLLVAMGPAAAATSSAQESAGARAAGDYRVRYSFDKDTLKPGTRVHDASGNGRYGVVRVSGKGRLTVLKNGATGRAAAFPRACAGCGRAIITTESRPALNPGKQPFSFGATVRVTDRQTPTGRDPNIIMKGATNAAKYKLHLLTAKPRCAFSGAASTVFVDAPNDIDDGRWHRVVCSRQVKLHRLFIDGKLVAQSNSAYSGKIVTPDPLKVGGRAVGAAGKNDQFHGDLDNVFVDIGAL